MSKEVENLIKCANENKVDRELFEKYFMFMSDKSRDTETFEIKAEGEVLQVTFRRLKMNVKNSEKLT